MESFVELMKTCVRAPLLTQDDIVDGVIRALDTPLGYQIYNLGNGRPTRLNDFIRLVEEHSGKQAIINVMPEQPGDVPRTCADISKARELLGYDPQTPFSDGIAKLVKWYNETRPSIELPEDAAQQVAVVTPEA